MTTELEALRRENQRLLKELAALRAVARPRLYIDMDGVLADFVGGMCRRHNRPNPWVVDPSCPHELLTDALGLDNDTFWAVTDFDFWANLEKTANADRIVDAAITVFGMDSIQILSSPTYRCHGCVPGKMHWLKTHYPELGKRAILSRAKGLLALPNSLLLDDLTHQVLGFRKAGGAAILCPAQTNERRHEVPGYSPRVDFEEWVATGAQKGCLE